MTLSEYILNYRKEYDLSQRAFAEKCGLSNVYISMLEKNMNKNGEPIKPSLDTLKAIAKATNVPLDSLLHYLDDDFEISLIKEAEEEIRNEQFHWGENCEPGEPDIRAIGRAAKKMTPEQRAGVLKFIEAFCPDLLEDTNGEEDKD